MSVRTTYQITGMTCGHCASAVTGELTALPGVKDVEVDLAAGNVAVTSDAVRCRSTRCATPSTRRVTSWPASMPEQRRRPSAVAGRAGAAGGRRPATGAGLGSACSSAG